MSSTLIIILLLASTCSKAARSPRRSRHSFSSNSNFVARSSRASSAILDRSRGDNRSNCRLAGNNSEVGGCRRLESTIVARPGCSCSCLAYWPRRLSMDLSRTASRWRTGSLHNVPYARNRLMLAEQPGLWIPTTTAVVVPIRQSTELYAF